MVAPALVFAGGVAVGAVVATNALRRRLARRRPRRVLVGLEVAESEGWRVLASNRGKDGTDGEDGVTRVGVFTNHTGVCPRTGRHIVDMLHALGSVDLRAVFAPEHGFRGEKQAGWCATGAEDETRDERTGAELIDAYRTRGDPAALAREIARHQLDCVVFDVQDVGARFYTYFSSLYDLLVAAARLNAARDEKAHDENARRRRRIRLIEERPRRAPAAPWPSPDEPAITKQTTFWGASNMHTLPTAPAAAQRFEGWTKRTFGRVLRLPRARCAAAALCKSSSLS